MKKKKENFNHKMKRMSGYLKYRKYITYKYNLYDLLSYKKLQDKAHQWLKEEGFYDWDCTLTDGEDEL